MDAAFERLLTPRLVLRRFTSVDAERFAAYRSVPEVARYQSWEAPYPLERAQAMIEWLGEHHPDEPGEWYQVAIAERAAPDVLVGDCGFRPRVEEPLVVDIGFTLGPSAQGHGYATEAVGELYTSSLVALGLILFFITFVVLALARLMLMRIAQKAGK